MIDTVVLSFAENQFKVKDYDAFQPSAKGIFEAPYYKLTKGYIKCTQNPSAGQKRYFPRLTINKALRDGRFSIVLKVELSLPKLYYADNLREVEEYFLQTISYKLSCVLAEMGVVVNWFEIPKAQILAVHYGKNFVLKGSASVYPLLNVMSKLDISKRLDVGDIEYKNNGQSIRYHTNSYEVVFYDKIQEMKKAIISQKRTVEVDDFKAQNKSIILESSDLNVSVLRMEVRLNGKARIRRLFKQFGINLDVSEYTLKNIFRQSISRQVLLHYWDAIMSGSINMVLLSEDAPPLQLQKLISMGIKPAKALQIVASIQIIKEPNVGIRGLRTYLGSSTLYKNMSDHVDRIDLSKNTLLATFKEIRQKIDQMEAVLGLIGKEKKELF